MADGGDGGAGGGEGPLRFLKKDSSTAIYIVQVYFSGWPPLGRFCTCYKSRRFHHYFSYFVLSVSWLHPFQNFMLAHDLTLTYVVWCTVGLGTRLVNGGTVAFDKISHHTQGMSSRQF